ncbi:hypothetical protein CRUP_026859, partial [Coryphaenoides rupestris]
MEDRYVAQLKAEFDSCDTTATGYLDKGELTELCHKLHLEAHLHLLLDTLLGDSLYARVNFEEFKEGFVAVLSRSLDLSTSDDESSYLVPVVPEEVKPKFVKGTKRYGRRTRPDTLQDGTSPGTSLPVWSQSPGLIPVSWSGDLAWTLSLKSEEDCVQEGREEGGGGGALVEVEVESPMCDELETSCWVRGQLIIYMGRGFRATPPSPPPPPYDPPTSRVTHIRGMYCAPGLMTGCGLLHWSRRDCGSLPRPKVTAGANMANMEPTWPTRRRHAVRPSSPSLLSVAVGPRVLSCLDDGSGSAAPDRVLALWTEEGVRNGRDILQMLDFSLEERLSLCDLSVALDNEMLASRNTIHQAALVSYRYEIQHLQVQAEQACWERDKVRTDLEQADRRNLQLVREVDDRHAAMETLNHSQIRDLEQEYRDKLMALRSQSEQEMEAQQQQIEAERAELTKEVELLRVQESRLQEDLHTTTQENRSLEEEVCVLKERFGEAEKNVCRLQGELDLLLQDKFVSLDSQSAGLALDDGAAIRDLQTHCRELQDRNDELSSELLRSQSCGRKSRRSTDDPLWSRPDALNTESDSDECETKRGVSPLARRKLDQNGDGVRCEDPAVSIQTELAMEQLRDKHSQEIHSLRVELETKVNFYERSLELMRNNMEVERKNISQSFKLEISEVEEERSRAEREVLELKEKMEKMAQQKAGAWSSEQERRAQREWAELDQNYAREISHLVQKLSAEKEELAAELKLKMDQEVMLVRAEAEEKLSEVKLRYAEVQQQQSGRWRRARWRSAARRSGRRLEEVEREHERRREEEERLHKENSRYREEVLELSGRNLQLSGENAELSSRLRGDEGAVRLLRERLEKVTKEQQEEAAKVRELEEKETQKERERLHLLSSWKHEQELLERELASAKEKVERVEVLEEDLVSLRLKQQWVEQDKTRLLEEAEHRTQQVEALQVSVSHVDGEMELLRSQLQSATQGSGRHAQEVASQHRKLQEAQQKVEELQARLQHQQEVQRAQEEHQEQNTRALQEEIQTLRLHNQDLLQRLSAAQAQEVEFQRLSLELQSLRSRHTQLESARVQAEDQVVRSDTSRVVLQAQVSQQLQEARQEEAETKVKSLRLLLQEKTQQLQEQVHDSNQSSQLLQDLYLENSQLVKALQVTEMRQKNAQKKNFLLEDKVAALNTLIREIVTMALA